MIAGGTPAEVDTPKTGFKLMPALLRQYPDKYGDRVKGVVFANSSNPTGIAYTQAKMNGLATLIKGKPILAIRDEIHSELNYGGEYPSMAKTISDQTILANGFSKPYAMTGWRTGYLCATTKVTDLLLEVHTFAVTDIATFVQDAAEAILKVGDEATKEMDAQYIKWCDYMYKRPTEMGFGCSQPMGAFYIFAKIPPFFDQDDNKLVYQLVNEVKVAVTAGSSFGKGGEGYLRLNYVTNIE